MSTYFQHSAQPPRQESGYRMSTSSAHHCTICGAPTRDALCGNRLLLHPGAHHLPTEDIPPVFWRCGSHQHYQMRQATWVHVSEQGDLIYRLTCGHEVCWVCRGQGAYTSAKLAHALTTRQIRLDQPQRCYVCGDLERESQASHEP